MNFYYWAPFISNVATTRAVLNSTISIKKFSKKICPHIINVVGEWNGFEEKIKANEIPIITFGNNEKIYKNLPRFGFLKSRFTYILISLLSIFQLYKFLSSKKENDYIIIHLITSLPLLLLLFFNFKCKFILRVSGLPKLNIFRKFLWKSCGNKLHKITTPTLDTKKMLIKRKIFFKEKIFLLRDPIIDIKEINSFLNNRIKDIENTNYILSVGRLTKQKNHKFLINGFKTLKKKFKDLKLVILGEGELEEILKQQVDNLELKNEVIFLGYKKNVFKYFQKALCFVMTSEWEDPGFVMIEAAACKTPIISSNCMNGPKEFIGNNERGYLYQNFKLENFILTFEEFMKDHSLDKKKINQKIFKAFCEIKNYTKFSHFKELEKIL